MEYFRERNYINEASSLLLDLCCLSICTCEMKLCTFTAVYASYIVYKSPSQKPAKIGGFSEPLKPLLIMGMCIKPCHAQ